VPPELGRAARRAAGKAVRKVGLRDGGPTPGPGGNLTSRGRKVLLETVLFDQAWVELQLGRSFGSVGEAADAFLSAPGTSPHPLFFAEYLDPRFGRPPRGRNPLLWYLNHAWVRQKATPHPLVDLDAMVQAHPELEDANGAHEGQEQVPELRECAYAVQEQEEEQDRLGEVEHSVAEAPSRPVAGRNAS